MSEKPSTEFERVAQGGSTDNVLTDFWYFIKHTKKWWLVPLMGLLVLFGAMMLLSGTAAAPFIYTLF